jgi:hypothetical protein
MSRNVGNVCKKTAPDTQAGIQENIFSSKIIVLNKQTYQKLSLIKNFGSYLPTSKVNYKAILLNYKVLFCYIFSKIQRCKLNLYFSNHPLKSHFSKI